MRLGMEDHVIATAIVYIGEKGKLPPALTTVAEALSAFRGCDEDQAALLVFEGTEAAELLRELVDGHADVPFARRLNFARIVAEITGWGERRTAFALHAAQDAGMIKLHREQMGAAS